MNTLKLKLNFFFDEFINDFNKLSISAKLICLMPISIILGPLISDGSLVVVVLLNLFSIIKAKNFKIFKNNFIKLFFLFWIILLISSISYYSFYSNELWLSLKSSFTYLRFGLFAIILSYLLKTEKYFLKVFRNILFITLTFVIIHALLIYFLRFDFLQPHKFHFFYFEHLTHRLDDILNKDLKVAAYWTDHRISGVFFNELVLGTYLLKMGFLFFALNLFDQKKKIIPSFIFLLVLIFTIFITGDRSPTVLSLMGFVMILFTFRIGFKTKLLSFFIILLIITSFIKIDPNIKNRFVEQIKYYQAQEKSYIKIFNKNFWYFSEGHAQHLTTALRIFNDNKIIGTGTNTFRYECKKAKYNITVYSCTTHPHNTYAQLLSDTGLIGFLFILIFFIYISLLIFMNFLKKKYQYYHSNQSILILLFMIFWPIIPSGSFFNNAVSIYNFLIFGFFLYLSSFSKYNSNFFIK